MIRYYWNKYEKVVWFEWEVQDSLWKDSWFGFNRWVGET